jgi:hypothetical protein
MSIDLVKLAEETNQKQEELIAFRLKEHQRKQENTKQSLLDGQELVKPLLDFLVSIGWKGEFHKKERVCSVSFITSEYYTVALYMTPFLTSKAFGDFRGGFPNEIEEIEVQDGNIAVFPTLTRLYDKTMSSILAYGTSEELAKWFAEYTLSFQKTGDRNLYPVFNSDVFNTLLVDEKNRVDEEIKKLKDDHGEAKIGFWERLFLKITGHDNQTPAEVEF